MDPNQPSWNRQMDHLGVNKMGKNIKKSPLHQPIFASTAKQPQQPQPQPQPQPQVYNINKNDFRNLVQQLTGSPVRDPPPRPPQNHPRPPNNRLQRVRPPPLAPTNRPRVPVHPYQPPYRPPEQAPQPYIPLPYGYNHARPLPGHCDQPSPVMLLPPTPTDVWTNTAESPISAYMRYLQNSIIDTGNGQPQPSMQPVQSLPSARLNGPPQPLPSPRLNGPPPPLPSPRSNGPPPPLPDTWLNGPPQAIPSPRMNRPPLVTSPQLVAFPSPSADGSHFLPSPTSQFLLPSPTGFWNLLSPRSQYPLLSPGPGYPPPMSPNFSFASVGQSGILGAGNHPPLSPGYGFPLSPSGFFPIHSPRWRNQ